jgi:hypothetical protein
MLTVTEVEVDEEVAEPSDPVVPTDPAERLAAIMEAIGKLDINNATLWTGSGMPKVPAIAEVTGWDVSGQERDAAWAQIQSAK